MTTKIEWTNETWNPIRGCSRVSPGCDNCYAMRQARRQDRPGGAYEGLTRYRPLRRDDGGALRQGVDWSGRVRFVEDRLSLPLRWRKPRMVFVNSMGDLFHPQVTNEQIAAVFGVMAACPQHTFQVLTKRPERMRDWFDWVASLECNPWTECHAAALARDDDTGTIHCRSGGHRWRPWPLPHVMLGVSVEDQQRAGERIPLLLQTPAAVRFVSCEPLLGAVDLQRFFDGYGECDSRWCKHGFVNWVIAGCEAGPGARPAETDWFRSLRDQCQTAGVPYFLKQMMVPWPGGKPKLAKMPKLDGRVWDQRPEVM